MSEGFKVHLMHVQYLSTKAKSHEKPNDCFYKLLYIIIIIGISLDASVIY